MTAAAFFARTALIDGDARQNVRIEAQRGRITAVQPDSSPRDADVALGLVLPGAANAHSHAFHRVLRGRSHDEGGDFWQWRQQMYAAAGALDPDSYHALALGVFAEMVAAGWTAVGEFHYVHHRPDGSPYVPAHAMEQALSGAAREVGIRLTLLDTCYLSGGIGIPLADQQIRFGDGSARGWLDRWFALRDVLGPDVVLGAAIHSVRAVPRADIALLVRELPADVPLHIHLSEQPQENADCLREFGVTPTRLLADLGALSPRVSAVHATHLTAEDVRLLGDAAVTVVMCPTTEADLGDGIGPARTLADAGARIALGSDQNAVVDPLLEARGLEAGERLASGERGRFRPAQLTQALTTAGYAALGREGGIRPGAVCDLVEIDDASVRTLGAAPAQIPLVATSADVARVIVGGVLRARGGALASGRRPADLLAAGLTRFTPSSR